MQTIDRLRNFLNQKLVFITAMLAVFASMGSKGINANLMLGFAGVVLAFVVLGIVVSVGANILTSVNTSLASGATKTTASLITENATSGINNVAIQLPLLGTILIFGLIIAALFLFFFIGFRKSGGL